MNYIFIIPFAFLGLMVQVAFIMAEKREQFKKAVVLKGLASLIFVGIGALAYVLSPTRFSLLILIGLACGLVGDVCLNLRLVFADGKKVFLAGIAAFLAGHLCYMAAMILQLKEQLPVLLISIGAGCAATAGLLVWIFKNITAEKVFKIFGVFYIGAVVIMTSLAAAITITAFELQALVFLIGAVLFTASDVILIFNMFSEHKKAWMRPTNLTLYYIGQLLIAAASLI